MRKCCWPGWRRCTRLCCASSLVVRFERTRRQAAVERELQRERIELSQAIHDTAAQTAFMIGLGIDAAKEVAGDSNEELTARLDATSRLSKTAVWQLRHPIDMGQAGRSTAEGPRSMTR